MEFRLLETSSSILADWLKKIPKGTRSTHNSILMPIRRTELLATYPMFSMYSWSCASST